MGLDEETSAELFDDAELQNELGHLVGSSARILEEKKTTDRQQSRGRQEQDEKHATDMGEASLMSTMEASADNRRELMERVIPGGFLRRVRIEVTSEAALECELGRKIMASREIVQRV